eukprot:1156989-Amphidinium_carterae.1
MTERLEAEVAEEAIAKVPGPPGAPTEQERQKHMATHVPFRAWCTHCVQGRAKDRPHFKQPCHQTERRRFHKLSLTTVSHQIGRGGTY